MNIWGYKKKIQDLKLEIKKLEKDLNNEKVGKWAKRNIKIKIRRKRKYLESYRRKLKEHRNLRKLTK